MLLLILSWDDCRKPGETQQMEASDAIWSSYRIVVLIMNLSRQNGRQIINNDSVLTLCGTQLLNVPSSPATNCSISCNELLLHAMNYWRQELLTVCRGMRKKPHRSTASKCRSKDELWILYLEQFCQSPRYIVLNYIFASFRVPTTRSIAWLAKKVNPKKLLRGHVENHWPLKMTCCGPV